MNKLEKLDLFFFIFLCILFIEFIFKGAYGRVYRGEWNGLSVAIKRVNTDTIHEQQSFTREISCLVYVYICIFLFISIHFYFKFIETSFLYPILWISLSTLV